MNILFVRLNRGDDIVSEVTMNDVNDTITLHNPLKVVYTTIPNSGVMSVNLVPWTFSRLVDTTDFVLFADNILTMAKASDSITEYYSKSLVVYADLQSAAKEMQDEYESRNLTEDMDDDGEEGEWEDASDEDLQELENLMSDQQGDYKRKMH